MKCPKCSYVSHDYLDACRKCGMDLVDFKKELHLQVVRPGDLDLSVMLSEHIEEMGSTTGEFGVDKTFFETQVLVEPEEGAAEGEEGFDISLDDEFPHLPAEAVSPLEGSADIAEDEDFAALDEDDEAEIDVRPSGSAAVERAVPASPPVDMIDMSDLDLDDVVLGLPEEAPGDMAETLSEPEPATEAAPALTLDVDRAASAAAPELEDVALALPETPAPEARPARPPAAPPESMPTPATDDLLEAELELETEPAPPAAGAPKPEVALDLDLEELELDDDEKNA